MQRYLCRICKKTFQNKRQPQRNQRRIWSDYVWGKQSLKQLSRKYQKSIPWVRKSLQKSNTLSKEVSPQSITAIADITFFGRGYGILVVRSQQLKENLYWKEVTSEKPEYYQEAREELERQGFHFQAIVLDGRKGVREVFSDIPVQMCLFHQKMILRRYLTLHPKLKAGIELKALGETLVFIQEKDFKKLLLEWNDKWREFLKEKTYKEDKLHWHYTHKKIRSAYRSLQENEEYLFTHQRHPELNIPKTTNSLDGSFGHMKTLLKIHRGISKERKKTKSD